MTSNEGIVMTMEAIEIESVSGCDLNAQELENEYTEYVKSEYAGYFPDSRGVSLLGQDFVRLVAQQIDKEHNEGEKVEFEGDATDEVVANLREALQIHTFRAPLLAIARTIVSSWIEERFGHHVATKSCGTLFKSYCDSVLQPVNDDKEMSLNTARYVAEGDRVQELVNEVPETNIDHLSGDHAQAGVFLVFDGVKYNGPREDANMLMFE